MHSDFQILDFFQNEQGSFFSLKNNINDTLFDFEINMHGRHNVLNKVTAIIVSLDEGMTYSSISKSLKTFPQVERRFEIISKMFFRKI